MSSRTSAAWRSPRTSRPAPRATPAVIAAEEGEAVRAFGAEIRFKLAAAETAGALTVGLAEVPPGGGPPPHSHASEDELILILEGEYVVFVEHAWCTAGPGALLWLPRGVTHTFRVVGDQPGRHWVITTPSGFERFYARAAEVFAKAGPVDFARLSAIAADHEVTFVGAAHGSAQT